MTTHRTRSEMQLKSSASPVLRVAYCGIRLWKVDESGPLFTLLKGVAAEDIDVKLSYGNIEFASFDSSQANRMCSLAMLSRNWLNCSSIPPDAPCRQHQ